MIEIFKKNLKIKIIFVLTKKITIIVFIKFSFLKFHYPANKKTYCVIKHVMRLASALFCQVSRDDVRRKEEYKKKTAKIDTKEIDIIIEI